MGRTDLRIAGRYRLVERLGDGGMSVVWRGYDETLGRSVAVKVLSPRLAADQQFRDRLRQEAHAAARLCHPHITSVFDFGEYPLDEHLTVPYVVMELHDGETVADRLNRQGPLPWGDALTVAAEVASALATAHATGLVHRDVTPANVMLTGVGAKVVDFGISAVVGQRDSAPDGSLLGTPAYLAPERLGGAQVSPATDVYALGLLLYRALTGRLPWPAATTADALRAHLYADPQPLPLSDLAGLPPSAAELCMRCLAKDPAERPTAAAVAGELGPMVGLQPVIPLMPPVFVTAAAGMSVGRPRSLRLRAGLKVGAALHLGAVRPLGGGLFAGGNYARDLFRLSRDHLVKGGHLLFKERGRTQAVLLTVVALAITGFVWSGGRATPDVGRAQAAPAEAAPVSSPCEVRYQLEHDSGSDYEAQLTVATSGDVGRAAWRVQFSYPGTQRLTGVHRSVTQRGRAVVVKGRGTLKTYTLRGAYRGSNPLPLAFTLNGARCRTEILGSASDRTARKTKTKSHNSVSRTPSPTPSPHGATYALPGPI